MLKLLSKRTAPKFKVVILLRKIKLKLKDRKFAKSKKQTFITKKLRVVFIQRKPNPLRFTQIKWYKIPVKYKVLLPFVEKGYPQPVQPKYDRRRVHFKILFRKKIKARVPEMLETQKFRFWERRNFTRLFRVQHPVDIWGRVSSRKVVPFGVARLWARRNIQSKWWQHIRLSRFSPRNIDNRLFDADERRLFSPLLWRESYRNFKIKIKPSSSLSFQARRFRNKK